MNTKKATKRALLTSVMALVMCVVMLVGTTFAWFTDTASTGVNKITSGNLHVEIQDKTGKKIENLEWVKEDGTVIDNQEGILWEPGCTYLLTPFQIVNTGNLALKYKIVITGLDGDADLLKVIKFTYATADGETFDMTAEGHLTAKGTDGAATQLITVTAEMDKLAGNEYKEKTLENVKFTVYATQDTVENDSYGPDYDKDAYYYDTLVTDLTGLTGANAEALEGTVAVSAQTYDLSKTTDIGNSRGVFHIGDESLMNSKVDTLILDGGVMNSPYVSTDMNKTNACISVMAPNKAKIIVRNMTFNGCFSFYDYLYADQKGNRNEIEFVNCTFNGVWQAWTTGYTAVTFKGCTFTNEGLELKNFWIANAFQTWFRSNCADTVYTYDNCTFNGNRGISIESKGATVNVTNCIFNLQASSASNEDTTKVNAIKLGADIGKANITDNTMNSGHAFFDVKDASKVISSNNTLAEGVLENK